MFTLLGYTIDIKNEFGERVLSFYRKYIMLNLNEYDSFGGFDFYITIFLWLLTAGLCAGIFFSNYKRNKAIRLTKKLLRHGARTEEEAKTLGELGLEVKKYSKILGIGTRLSRVVKVVGAREISYEEYLALEKEKKEKKKNSALSRPTTIRSEVTGAAVSAVQVTEETAESAEESIIAENIAASSSEGATESVTESSSQTAENAILIGGADAEKPSATLEAEKPTAFEQKERTSADALDKDARLFVPESAEDDAQTIVKRGEATPLQSALAAVFCVCISVCLTFVMPVLLGFLDNLLS